MPTNQSLQHYHPRGIFSTWLGMVLLFALIGLLALVIVKASPRGSDYEKKRAEARMKKLEEAQKENANVLNSYAWVDKNKGVVRIPIDHAMGIVMAELAEKKPTAAGPIAAASPGPGAAPQASPGASVSPAGSATPAPTAAPSASTTPKPTSVSGEHSEAHNQPAAAANPPNAPPNTQPGPSTSPAASVPPAPAKPEVKPSPSASPSAPGTPLPVRGKTP